MNSEATSSQLLFFLSSRVAHSMKHTSRRQAWHL
jgi:hypothetical protein